ncbi:transmembrane protein 127 [Bombina bombina]|uniref:transmembrane protein 127 n=1 Tax=Bombina bombina TaxID=8345 RepID=UPI00235A6D22|nr:transmembrane protein 127 [Bombina bombina]
MSLASPSHRSQLGCPQLPRERCLAAALLQGLAVVSVCTSVSDPSWLQVRLPGEEDYVYGVAFVLHLGGNLTGTHYLLHKDGISLLLLMTMCCYISILMGFAAFLLDFLETRNAQIMGMKLAVIMHFITAISTAAAVGLCSYLFVLLLQEIAGKSIKTSQKPVIFGESFFFAIFACVMSLFAALLSLCYSRTYRREANVRNFRQMTEDSNPLLQEPTEAPSVVEYG